VWEREEGARRRSSASGGASDVVGSPRRHPAPTLPRRRGQGHRHACVFSHDEHGNSQAWVVPGGRQRRRVGAPGRPGGGLDRARTASRRNTAFAAVLGLPGGRWYCWAAAAAWHWACVKGERRSATLTFPRSLRVACASALAPGQHLSLIFVFCYLCWNIKS